MKKTSNGIYIINSIPELHKTLGIPEPEHPLISVNELIKRNSFETLNAKPVVYNFYSVCMKKNFEGKVTYGQTHYDHDSGVISFYSPGQVTATEIIDDGGATGEWLVFHPDFLKSYPLSEKIKEYGYFSYSVNEALHLSEREEKTIERLMMEIKHEYQGNIDSFSHDLIISHLDLLLNYCNRFYNRQFLTRKSINNDLLSKFEALLNEYFENKNGLDAGLPSVHYFSEKLFLSSQYLSDLLKSHTGSTTQQHIHNKVIEKAKEQLMLSNKTVAELAYELGFERPQSFNKLFKKKTGMSPNEFRNTLN